jgi:hypothetical protein
VFQTECYKLIQKRFSAIIESIKLEPAISAVKVAAIKQVFGKLQDKIARFFIAKIRARARAVVFKELVYMMEMKYPNFYTEFDDQKV